MTVSSRRHGYSTGKITSLFPEVHPTLHPKSIADEKTGSKYESSTEDNDFIRCRKCRFPFDRKHVGKGFRDGNNITQGTLDVVITLSLT